MIDSLITKPIAIVGMSCRLPGADGLDSLWKLLIEGRDAITELPHDRLDQELYFDPKKGVRGKTYSKLGGMIPLRPLNLQLVPMASQKLDEFDECHWILTEVASAAWQHAGMHRRKTSDVGVYVGHSGGSRQPGELIYATLAEQTANIMSSLRMFQQFSGPVQQSIRRDLVERMRKDKSSRRPGGLPNLDASAAARLIAETLGTIGPQMVIDAACASSLVALGMACLGLQTGRIGTAVVAGASYNKCDSMVLFSQAQSCSSTGTRPFDEEADGLISSEGYIALVLKTLEKAIEDKDKIWGVLRGIGISTDGRGKSLWAPRREGQLLAVKRAYSTEVHPENVQFIEAHATSTQIGDATEIQALAEFFTPLANGRKIPIGSIKSNIGHTLETAGLAGLLKTLLAMHHETIPATANLKSPSHSIPWNEIPFDVPTSAMPWMTPTSGLPRCGAVNAFGIGGLNVHVVVEQFQQAYHQKSSPKSAVALTANVSNVGSVALAEPIAIVGRGIIVPGACGMDSFVELLRSGRSEISSPPSTRWRDGIGIAPNATLPWNVPTNRGGYLLDYAYDWRKHRVPPKQVQNANPLQFMLLDAAGQAIEEANRQGSPLTSDRTSVVVGTIFGGEFGHQLQMGLRLVELRRDLRLALRASSIPGAEIEAFVANFEEEFLKVNPALLDETGSFTSSTLASRITKQYNLMGGAMAIDAAECSALAGLLAATSLLQNKSSDAVICASGHRALDLPAFETLFAKGNLRDTPSEIRCPGEGVAVLVLKRLDDAIRDNNQIFGIIDSIETLRPVSSIEPKASVALKSQIGDLQGTQGMISILECFTHENRTHHTIEMSSNEQIMYRIQLRHPQATLKSQVTAPQIYQHPEPLILSQATPKVTIRKASKRPRFALFPGQGSQHANMLEPWYQDSESARHALQDSNRILQSLGSPGFDQLVERAVSGSDHSSWSTQASMLVADWVLWNAWQDLGIEVDGVAGHSLGELVAMLAAEVWDIESAIRFVRQRAEAVDVYGPVESGLLSIQADIDIVQNIIRHTPRTIFITHHNGPKQVVVGGKRSDLTKLKVGLDNQRILSAMLAVPAPFHTPMMAQAAEHLAEVVQDIQLLPPRIPFLSSVSNRYEAEPNAIRRNLISQLISPVHYVDMLMKLKMDNVEQLIEIGPGQVLTKLNIACLSDCDIQCLSMGNTSDKQSFVNALYLHSDVSTARTSDPHRRVPKLPSHERQEVLMADATSSRRKEMRERAESISRQRPDSLENSGASILYESIPLATLPTSSPSPDGSRVSDANRSFSLETFVRDFIVEQTGYPQDMIQLDWDLEADLGIDSIKLVQLMGELRELFELEPATVRGSNVRTLRDILSLLEKAGGKREWLDDKALDSSPLSEDSIRKLTQIGNATPIVPSNVGIQSSNTFPEGAGEAPPDAAILKTFMIDFVIEQTGYPREMVDLEADLEADLGLDSIKLAQLFGELRSHFHFQLLAEQRTILSGVKSLSDILNILTKNADSNKNDLKVVENTYSHSDRSDPMPTPAFLRGKSFSKAIQKQLVDDCIAVALSEVDEIEPMARWFVSEDPILQSLAAGANVHVDNLIGLLARHGSKSDWHPLFDGLSESLVAFKTPSTVNQEIDEPSGEVAQRYILRTVESALVGTSSCKVRWHGPALILGDNPVAAALLERLKSEGVDAKCLDATESLETLLAKFDKHWGTHGIPHLFIATPHDPGACMTVSNSQAHEVRNRVSLSVFWLCQQWLIRSLRERNLNDSSIVALTQLGGDFGFKGEIASPESGAISGLLKAILIESWVNGHRGIPIKIVDSKQDEPPEELVDAVFHELANPSFDTEIAWNQGRRSVVRAIPFKAKSKRMRPTPGVWICTGGGRGITARVASELAGRYGLSLHLIGTAPEPSVKQEHRDLNPSDLKKFKNQVMADARASGKNSVKAWQDMEKQLEIDANLRLLHAQGIEAVYYCCDVSKEADLKRCLDRIRTQFGPIRGCLHGAGVGQDSRFERKRVEKVQECIRAKVDGVFNLMRHTWNDPLEYFIGFGSISGRFGANGHTDYSSANEALAKYIGWYRQQRPKVAAVAFHWHAWGDVGMATKPETKLALEMIDMQFMPANEGIRHLMREIEAGAPEREVLITDDRYYRMFYPAETLSPSCDSNGAFVAKTPLLDPITDREPSSRTSTENQPILASCTLDAKRDIFLKEHRFNGAPLLPFVISLELIVETSLRNHALQVPLVAPPEVLIEGLEVVRGLKLDADEKRCLSIECRPNENRHEVHIYSVFKNRQGTVIDAKREYSHGLVSFGSIGRLLDWQRPEISDSNFVPPVYSNAEQAFYVGPSFRVLRRVAESNRRVIGQILAPSLIELVGSHRATDGWMTPSAVLDACLFTTGILAWNQLKPGISLPIAIERLRIASMPDAGEPCLVESRLLKTEERKAWFDFCLWGRDSRVLVEARGYCIAWVG